MGKKKGRFFSGLFLGSIVGGIVSLLYAPQDGEKTRKWIKKTKEENQDKIDEAKKVAEETGHKVVREGKKVKDIVEDNLSKFKKKFKNKSLKKDKNPEGKLQ